MKLWVIHLPGEWRRIISHCMRSSTATCCDWNSPRRAEYRIAFRSRVHFGNATPPSSGPPSIRTPIAPGLVERDRVEIDGSAEARPATPLKCAAHDSTVSGTTISPFSLKPSASHAALDSRSIGMVCALRRRRGRFRARWPRRTCSAEKQPKPCARPARAARRDLGGRPSATGPGCCRRAEHDFQPSVAERIHLPIERTPGTNSLRPARTRRLRKFADTHVRPPR